MCVKLLYAISLIMCNSAKDKYPALKNIVLTSKQKLGIYLMIALNSLQKVQFYMSKFLSHF